MARPKKLEANLHDNRVDVRLTAADYAAAEQIASAYQIPVATVIRSAFLLGLPEFQARHPVPILPARRVA